MAAMSDPCLHDIGKIRKRFANIRRAALADILAINHLRRRRYFFRRILRACSRDNDITDVIYRCICRHRSHASQTTHCQKRSLSAC